MKRPTPLEPKGLERTPNVYPILARTRFFFIYSYTAVIILALLLTLFIMWRRAHSSTVTDWFNGVLFALAGAVIGGKLTFILTQTGYYAERPSELGTPWPIGLTYHGVWAGGLVGVWLYGRFTPNSASTWLSLLAPALPLLFTFGWLACWLEGCAFGAETTFGWLSANLPDHLGVFAVRYRTQLLGIISGLLIGLWAWRRGMGRDGRLFWSLTAQFSLAHGIITLLRGDTVLTFGKIRIDTVLDTFLFVTALLLIQYAHQLEKNKPNE